MAIQVKPDYAVAYYARAIVEEQQGDADSAAADVAKARLYQAATSSLAGQPAQQAPSFTNPKQEYRLRFSVAHEIGHLILHPDVYGQVRPRER